MSQNCWTCLPCQPSQPGQLCLPCVPCVPFVPCVPCILCVPCVLCAPVSLSPLPSLRPLCPLSPMSFVSPFHLANPSASGACSTFTLKLYYCSVNRQRWNWHLTNYHFHQIVQQQGGGEGRQGAGARVKEFSAVLEPLSHIKSLISKRQTMGTSPLFSSWPKV